MGPNVGSPKYQSFRNFLKIGMTDFSDPGFTIPALLGIVAIVVGAIGLWREIQDRKLSKAAFDLLRTMRREVREPRQTTQIVSQQELRRRDELEWKKLKDVAKALGWVWTG